MSKRKELDASQVLYQGRWVPRETFRAFVYNADGQKLANSYEEYSQLIESGIWFGTKEDVEPKQPISIKVRRKAKDGANSQTVC